MDQESAKHSPRVDEAMAGDVASLTHGAPVESRSQESRLQEDPAVDGGNRPGADDPSGLGISPSDADRRAELARYLAGAAFPADRDELLAVAEGDFAPPRLVQELRRLPFDEEFESFQAVWTALGGDTEDAHT